MSLFLFKSPIFTQWTINLHHILNSDISILKSRTFFLLSSDKNHQAIILCD